MTGASGCDLAFFAINLDRSRERWQGIERGFAALPWPLHRVAALDAENEPETVLARRGLVVTHPPNGVGWNDLRSRPHALVEEACFASHLAALEQFLQSGHRYGVILEDDAMPVVDLARLLPMLTGSGVRFDVVKLEGIARRGGRPAFVAGRIGTRSLVRSFRPSSGAAAYLVTRPAAETLLARAGSRPIPFDDYLWNPAFHGLDVQHVAPWAVLQAGRDTTMSRSRTPVARRKKRDPYHYFAQALTRGSLRLALWYHVLKDARLALGNLRLATWADETAPFAADGLAEAVR